MKIKVFGVSKEMKAGVSKKTQNAYRGWFVSYGYKDADTTGLKVNTLFHSEESATASNYVPKPGDICNIVYGMYGRVEALEFIKNGGEL